MSGTVVLSQSVMLSYYTLSFVCKFCLPERLSVTNSRCPFLAIGKYSIQNIKVKFSKLVTESCKRLQRREISVEEFKLFLVTMCSSCNSADRNDMATANVVLANNLDGMFCALSKSRFWDYLNYYPLQNIIEEFAGDDDELRNMIEEYQKDLIGHTLALEIQKYLYMDATSHVHTSLAFSPPANVSDHSFSYMKDIWQSLENQFSLPQLEGILGTRKPVLRRAYSEGDARGVVHVSHGYRKFSTRRLRPFWKPSPLYRSRRQQNLRGRCVIYFWFAVSAVY